MDSLSSKSKSAKEVFPHLKDYDKKGNLKVFTADGLTALNLKKKVLNSQKALSFIEKLLGKERKQVSFQDTEIKNVVVSTTGPWLDLPPSFLVIYIHDRPDKFLRQAGCYITSSGPYLDDSPGQTSGGPSLAVKTSMKKASAKMVLASLLISEIMLKYLSVKPINIYLISESILGYEIANSVFGRSLSGNLEFIDASDNKRNVSFAIQILLKENKNYLREICVAELSSEEKEIAIRRFLTLFPRGTREEAEAELFYLSPLTVVGGSSFSSLKTSRGSFSKKRKV